MKEKFVIHEYRMFYLKVSYMKLLLFYNNEVLETVNAIKFLFIIIRYPIAFTQYIILHWMLILNKFMITIICLNI